MYSKEQLSTRLKLGVNINMPELVLIVKTLMEKLEELEKKYDELSKDRRGSDKPIGEVVQTSTIRSFFKQ